MKHRILVVEDNPLNLELLRDWLQGEGFEVHSAADLRSAFAQAERSQPHAVLLDIQLGADNGLMFAVWLRSHKLLGETPLIAVTAHALLSERDLILKSGCNDCISKPVDFRLLRQSLQRWLPSKMTDLVS